MERNAAKKAKKVDDKNGATQRTDDTQRIKATEPIDPKQPITSVNPGNGSNNPPINRTDTTDSTAIERGNSVAS